MSREPLVVSFDANSPLLTHFNVANEVCGADSNPAVLGREQVCKHCGGGAAVAASGHHGRWRLEAKMEVCGAAGYGVQQMG